MLAKLLNIPRSQQDWAIWSFNNRDQIARIRGAIQAQFSQNLPDYQLDPINFANFELFLENNQQAHIDFNNVLGAQSSDLLELDPRDLRKLTPWIALNYQELFTASTRLGVAY